MGQFPGQCCPAIGIIRDIHIHRTAQNRQQVVDEGPIAGLQLLAGYIVVEQILPQEVPMVVVNMVKPLFTGLQVAVAGEYEPVALIINERFLLTTGQFAFDHIALAIVQVTVTILVRSVVVPFQHKAGYNPGAAFGRDHPDEAVKTGIVDIICIRKVALAKIAAIQNGIAIRIREPCGCISVFVNDRILGV